MAPKRKFLDQFPVVATADQYAALKDESDRRHKSMAGILREMVNQRYGLVDDYFPPDDPRVETLRPLAPSNTDRLVEQQE